MPLTPYNKSWLTHAEFVDRFVQRGLIVNDRPSAEQFLSHVNYYRLSGYCLAFEIPGQRHSFIPGTTFEHLRATYDFDFALRDLVSEALEVVEIDLRTTVAHHFGQKYGAFGHTDPAHFYRRPPVRAKDPRPTFGHAAWLTRVREDVQRSKERFVEHFRKTYSEAANHDLPVWALSEVVSFGCISKMIDGMVSADQRVVASRYRLQNLVLVSWAHHLNVARNVCAHHSRLWDRLWGVPPEFPAGNNWRPPFLMNNQRLTVTLLVIYQMLKHMPAAQDWATVWQVRLRKLLARIPAATVTPALGFTDQWFANPLWI